METKEIVEGIIELGTDSANELGFTVDKFKGYLWKYEQMITISLIESLHPNQGHFTELLNAIWDKGFIVGVPTPLGEMKSILERKNFKPYRDGACVMWIKESR